MTPPVISFQLPSQGLKVMAGADYILAPDIQHTELDDFSIQWEHNGKIISTDVTCTFNSTELGKHIVSVISSNCDGKTQYDLNIEVLDHEPYVVSFRKQYYAGDENIRYTYAGYGVYLRPHIEYFDNPSYRWLVNGEEVTGENSESYIFTPTTPGEYKVTVAVSNGSKSQPQQIGRNVSRASSEIRKTVTVNCVNGIPAEKYRAESSSSSMLWNKIYDFSPAPGQFINKTSAGGYTGNEKTMEQAINFATNRLTARGYLSLGAWGGYVIVGFDHSVKNNQGNGYDFAIQGNAFSSSNEPGIVWVMQDANGNGLPDDEWYELRGSATGAPGVIQDYEVTYYRPAAPYASYVRWYDRFGNTGKVERNQYHGQEYYYPNWMPESYTIYGTLLPHKTEYGGNFPYDWGYVDNCGTDAFGGDNITGDEQMNGFKISNAIYQNGKPVKLDYIDFIKIQCGIMSTHPSFGEVSTEVFSVKDL